MECHSLIKIISISAIKIFSTHLTREH